MSALLVASVSVAAAPSADAGGASAPGTARAAAARPLACTLDVTQVGDRRFQPAAVTGVLGRPVRTAWRPRVTTDVPAASIQVVDGFDGHVALADDLSFDLPMVLRNGHLVSVSTVGAIQTQVGVVDKGAGYAGTLALAGPYALRAGGLLVRDDPTFGRQVRSGYAAVRSIVRWSTGPRGDVLLAALRDGRLVTLTVPATKTFAPKTHVIRGSGWGKVDKMVLGSCGSRGSVLMTVDTGRRRAVLHHVGPNRGASTGITSFGQVPGTWIGRLTGSYSLTSFADR